VFGGLGGGFDLSFKGKLFISPGSTGIPKLEIE